MSRKLLAFLLSELAVVRVICKSSMCGAVVEVPISKLSASFTHHQCRVCGATFFPHASDYLADLERAIQGIALHQDKVDVEFILSDEGDDE